MNAAANLLFGQRGKPALHEVDPGSAGGGEMDVEARALGEPTTDHRGFVSAVVVHNQVSVESRRYGLIEGVEKLAEFRAAVPAMELADDFPGLDIEGGKQRGRAMPRVVVGAAFYLSGSHGQQRLCPIQRLNL